MTGQGSPHSFAIAGVTPNPTSGSATVRLAVPVSQAVTVRVGASDGSYTEVSGDIREGDEVIVGSGRGAQ